MNIISTCQMGAGTFEAKFIPLSEIGIIDNIYVLRKQKGPAINKIIYLPLPKACRIKWISILITPVLLLYYTRKTDSKLILAYHIIPHAFYAFFASVFSGIPFSISQTGLLIEGLSDRWLYGKIILYIFRKAKYINVPGSRSRQHWINKGVNPDKIFILHSTVSTDEFQNTGKTAEYDFIFIGRLAWEKNIELILNAIIKLKEKSFTPKLAVVGEGPKENELKQFVYSNGLRDNVIFTGFQRDVPEWLNKASVFVMVSITEAMPTALMQAMACERICISSRVGNIADLIVHGENGFLFESNNLEELTSIMIQVLEGKDAYKDIKQKARLSVINNHSHVSAKKKWESHLANL
jgi:glycosyltransferase involved in cell wall biosynthesis